MLQKETREKASRIKEPNEKRRSLKVAPLERNKKLRLASVQRQVIVIILIEFFILTKDISW